jgi:DNA-binding winged helix-turn-helix (wHTH) protein/TolB-like protein
MRALEDQAFEFGGFVLLPNERLLLHAGDPIPLTGKAFDLLVILVRRSGHLVTKDELFAEVWPNTFVQETNLTVNMSAVRKALARTGDANEFIQTVPGRGYRFVAPVAAREMAPATVFSMASADGNSETAPRPPSVPLLGPRRNLRELMRAKWALIAVALLMCVGVATVAVWRAQTESKAAAFASVAILPFSSDSSAQAYLADGLTEAVVNGLAQFTRLRVAPRATASRFRGPSARPREAGRELGVAAVVTASVSQRDDDLRIQVDLVDVARGSQIWGAQYQGNVSELVRLQTRILQDLPRALGVHVSDQEARRLARPVSENADAYRAYLQGRHEWGQRSEAALRRAIELFQRAVAIDPQFAAAYSGLADSYSILGYLSYLAPAASFPEAKRYARQALALDPSLAEAHASLGFVNLYFDWNWPGAEAAFRRAIELDPNNAAPHQWYSIYFCWLRAGGRRH